jgi:excisionase family DNA binding protein
LNDTKVAEVVVDREELLTSQEVRSLLKIGRTKLWELTKNNALPAYRVGVGKTAGLRYKRSELLEWLERNRVGSDSAA